MYIQILQHIIHNGYKSQYNIDLLSDIVVMDSDDSIMPIDINDEINDKQTHNSMNAR